MRKLVVSSLFLSLTIFGHQNALAQNSGVQNVSVTVGEYQNAMWDNYSTNEKLMLDRVAADFYQASLRLSQTRKIEAATADIYLAKSPEERAVFREERQRIWNAMSEDQRRGSRNVKLPVFSNLTEAQKTPFRQIARDQLTPASPSQETYEASAYSGGDV
ncbi:MAG: hypothetical protein JKX88_10515 [Marinicaulis sp.]|nr:hypothetical protein [Marinicaulis sp.]